MAIIVNLDMMLAKRKMTSLELANRVVVSPVLTYSADDGLIGDFHLVHYGARATGGAGLVMTEMTAVSGDGRITPRCPGIHTDAQVTAWRRLTDFVHANSAAKIGIQLGHARHQRSPAAGMIDNDDLPEAAIRPGECHAPRRRSDDLRPAPRR